MDGMQRALWGMAIVTIGAALVGFFLIPGDIGVPHQFDLDGWTSFAPRNLVLPLFIGVALIAAIALQGLMRRYPVWWGQALAVAGMAVLMLTVVLAVVHATQAERIVTVAG